MQSSNILSRLTSNLLAACSLLCSGCGPTHTGSQQSPSILSATTASPTATTDPQEPPVEFILKLTSEEKRARYKTIQALPEYSKVRGAVGKLGFNISNYSLAPEARQYPDEDSLTGLGYEGESKRFIGRQEYRILVMGPTADRIDTVRLQAWGVQTRAARQQLHAWANAVLTSLQRGQLPPLFVQSLYVGKNIGDDGVSNGYCNVQVLQKPISPGAPNANDRISVDLIFDK